MADIRGSNWPSGHRPVNSTTIPEPRKSKAEIAAMSHDSQLIYFLWGPGSEEQSDHERTAALKREDEFADVDASGEVLPGTRAYEDGPWEPDDDGY